MASNIIAIGESSASQKPSGSAFKQQKLPAWQPILTAGTVLPTFFLIGVAFIPIGIGLLVSSNQVQEFQFDYTFCNQSTNNDIQSEFKRCSDVINENPGQSCTCYITFNLTQDYKKDVFIYYGLTNYYQNHRRYVKSRDDNQLYGKKGFLSSECDPYAYKKEKNNTSYPIAPCGAIANSLFNDTFTLKWYSTKLGKDVAVPITRTGIAWATDKNAKFRNPYFPLGQNLSWAFRDTVKPLNWQKNVWQLDDKGNNSNNGFENEALIVWMRTAALPTFRKIYGRIAHNMRDIESHYQNSLPAGRYTLMINYNYPVISFKGTKRFIISNTSWLGGKNPFLGVTYIVVGCICLILSGVFIFIHKKFGKGINEILSVNQRTPYIS